MLYVSSGAIIIHQLEVATRVSLVTVTHHSRLAMIKYYPVRLEEMASFIMIHCGLVGWEGYCPSLQHHTKRAGRQLRKLRKAQRMGNGIRYGERGAQRPALGERRPSPQPASSGGPGALRSSTQRGQSRGPATAPAGAGTETEPSAQLLAATRVFVRALPAGAEGTRGSPTATGRAGPAEKG